MYKRQVEERTRQRVYTRRMEKKRTRAGTGKQRKMVVTKDYTFIPRVAYQLDTYKINKTVQHHARLALSPHRVAGHIRRLPDGHKASKEAIAHAAEFGIRRGIGENNTFVRPHDRGAISYMQLYRSRSALEMLFGLSS